MRLRRAKLQAFQSLLALLPLFAAHLAPAATIHVPADQPTIQAGINAAATGDTVLVAPGTYYENIDFKGKALTVISSDGASKTVIDGGGLNPAVAFTTNEKRNSILSGFTLQHGGIPNIFYGNAGIYVVGSAPTIVNNVLTHNFCSGIHISVGSPLIQNNTINNTENSTSYCSFADGYAIWVDGALQSDTTLLPTILGNLIEDNTQAGKQFGGGAGVSIWGGNPIIQNNTIRNNSDYVTGGGIDIVSGGAVIVQNLIYANTAGGGGGGTGGAGGISIDLSAANGPGPVSSFVINNTIANNTFNNQFGILGLGDGSQVFIPFLSSRIAFVNNIITGSSQQPLVICDPKYESYFLQDVIFDHNDVYNPQGASYGGTCTDKTGTFGNISSDPSFVSPSTNDFHLSAASPAIDTGNNSAWDLPSQDFDGNPRQSDFSGKGYPVIDMGAYEHAGPQDVGTTLITLVPSEYVIGAYDPPLTLSSQLISNLGIPTGIVTFYEDGNNIGTAIIDASGKANLTSVPLSLGLHSFLATYLGQGAFPPAVSVVSYVVVNSYQPPGTTATSVSLISSSLSPGFGQPVTFTATVNSLVTGTGSPAGTITFMDGGSVLSTQTLSSTSTASAAAVFTTSSLSIGTHAITATYTPTGNFSPGSAALSQTINGVSTTATITSSRNPASVGQTVIFSVVITAGSSILGSPAGVVTLTSDGTTPLATLPLTSTSSTASSVSFSINSLLRGNHAIQANYASIGGFSGSIAALTQTIAGVPTTTLLAPATPNPAYALSPLTLSATVSTNSAAYATRTVTFYDGTTPLGTAALDSTAHATFITSAIATGTHTLSAVYNGDTTFTASTSNNITETVQLNPTATTLTLAPNPAVAFQRFGPTIQVKSLSSLPFSPSSCSPACTVTINITGLPPNVPSTVTSQIPPSGIISINGDAFAAGTYTFTATFNGSAAFAASSAPSVQETITVAPTTLTLSASPNPATQTQTVTFTSILTAPLSIEAPGGTITFFDGATPFATAPFSANVLGNTITATASTTTLAAGTHTITANYPGNVNFLPVTSAPVTLTINPSDFTLTVEPSITIQAEHHATTPLTLTSLGSLTGPVSLTCSNLPIWTTCTFTPSTAQLTSGSTATASLYLDTDAVIGYARNTPTTPKNGARSTITLALLLPAALLFTLRRKLRIPTRLVLLALATLAGALTISGCSGKYPPHTTPGAYNITVTGTGPGGLVHTANITLNVTP